MTATTPLQNHIHSQFLSPEQNITLRKPVGDPWGLYKNKNTLIMSKFYTFRFREADTDESRFQDCK